MPKTSEGVAPSAGEAGDSAAREASWVVLEASNGMVHTLAGEDPSSPRTNFLVAGRSVVMNMHLPCGWKVCTIDSQYKIMDKEDCPKVLEPCTVFGPDYIERDSFTAPRMLPRTERLSPKAYKPAPDPLQKGQMVVFDTQVATITSDDTDGPAVKDLNSICFSLALPSRELRLMTPTKGRRPVDAERYHVDRMAFGQFVVVLERADASTPASEDRFVFIRSPLIQFFFRMDVCNVQGTKGTASWKVRLPRSCAAVGEVHKAISKAISQAFSFLSSPSSSIELTAEKSAVGGEQQTSGAVEREEEGEVKEVERQLESEREELRDSDTDTSSDSDGESTRRKRLMPTGPRSRRMPKWREAYVINDAALRASATLIGTTSADVPTQEESTKALTSPVKRGKREKSSTNERQESEDEADEPSVASAKADVMPPAASQKKKKQKLLAPPQEGPDLTDHLLLHLKQLKHPEALCPYKGCPVVVISLEDDCRSHFSWHTERGDLLLYHTLVGGQTQQFRKLPVPSGPVPSDKKPKLLPTSAMVKTIAWEDPPLTYVQSLDSDKSSFRLWYNHILCFAITDERVRADCQAVPADAFGMKLCPARECKSVMPASRLEEHYRAHFVLCSIQRHRAKSKTEITAVAPEAGLSPPPELAPKEEDTALTPAPPSAYPRAANGRFAKRSKRGDARAPPRKRARRANAEKPVRKRGRPRRPRPPAEEPSFTPSQLPGLEPGKATAYGSANLLRQGALYTPVEAASSESDEDMEEGDCLLIDGISFGAMSE